MPDILLRKNLKQLCESACTLLWLEGTQHERVVSVKLTGQRLVIQLANNTTRVVAFERFSVTSVGLQFWSQGRPGVLYRWEQVPSTTWRAPQTNLATNTHSTSLEVDTDGDEPQPPPNMAA